MIELSYKKRKEMLELKTIIESALLPIRIYDVNGSYFAFQPFNWMQENGLHLDEYASVLSEPLPKQFEIYGDNLDFRKGVFHRSIDHKGDDNHWFLTLTAPLRVVPVASLDRTRPGHDILTQSNAIFLPTPEDSSTLLMNFKFHVMEILVNRLHFLQPLKPAVPPFIEHPYVKEMSTKSEYMVLDLMDKNESKAADIIDIVQFIHNFVPSIDGQSHVIECVTFSGDLLTNERAYQVQLDLMNGTSENERLLGIIHRTEGLHLNMNFLEYILQSLFSKSSATDKGMLYHLAAYVHRAKEITLDVTKSYNASRNIIDDCLDAHITACATKYFGMDSTDGQPTSNLPSGIKDRKSQHSYLEQCAGDILDIIFQRPVIDFAGDVADLEGQQHSMQGVVGKDGRIRCPFGECGKFYKQEGRLQFHMKKVHNVEHSLVPPLHTEPAEEVDGVFNYASALVKVALSYRDTHDAYSMGDGDRLFRNLKFLLLHFDKGHHIKYRLWSFRMMAYDNSLLSEYERQIYRNNISINIRGGIRHCIANDNLVEIHVKKVKECISAMGANYNFEAARKAAKCIDVVSDITDSLASRKSGRHSTPKTDKDVDKMAAILLENNAFDTMPGRKHAAYPNMASDLLENINLVNINSWLTEQRKRAAREM